MASLLEDIQAGQRMPGAKFILLEHCSRQGDSPVDLWDFETATPIAPWQYVGWAPSASTAMPSSNWGSTRDCPIAVMLENARGERVWLHVVATPELVAAGYEAGR